MEALVDGKVLRALRAVFLLAVLALPVSPVANIAVSKEFSESHLSEGDRVNVTILIRNFGDEDLKAASVIDDVPSYFLLNETASMIGSPQLMRFGGLNLKVSENKTLTYSVSVQRYPASSRGKVVEVLPARVKDQYGNLHYSNPVKVYLSKDVKNCNFNLRCEKEYGENHVKCREDCVSGGDDGLCDQKKDGRCDPDCPMGSDSDCLLQSPRGCGDGLCGSSESPLICPADCGAPKPATTTTLSGFAGFVQKTGYGNLMLYLVVVLLLAIALTLPNAARKKREEESKLAKEAYESDLIKELKNKLRDGADPKELVTSEYDKHLIDEARKELWK